MDRRTDQDVAVLTGSVLVGKIRLEIVDGAPHLDLILDPDLPPKVREFL